MVKLTRSRVGQFQLARLLDVSHLPVVMPSKLLARRITEDTRAQDHRLTVMVITARVRRTANITGQVSHKQVHEVHVLKKADEQADHGGPSRQKACRPGNLPVHSDLHVQVLDDVGHCHGEAKLQDVGRHVQLPDH